jgi:hypothetical protein
VSRRHVIITGTGRAGTTFLVQLLTELGMDTGFASSSDGIFSECNAGMEKELADPNAPYIVKSPHLCMRLEQVLAVNPNIVVEHAIVPVRELEQAAESRRDVARRNRSITANGGLWLTDVPLEQEDILARLFHQLLEVLARHEIPTTLLAFPRFVHDERYLFRNLRRVFPTITQHAMHGAFAKVVRPDLVHDF